MKELGGIIVPAVTPFDNRGNLRLDMLRKNYELWNESAVQGFMALGSNGEFRSLDDDEAFLVLKTASEVISDKKVFIAGTGRESLQHTIRFLKRIEAAALKIDYVSVLTPHYFRGLMTDEALIRYYTEIADISSYPVLIYCAPAFANGVCISPEALEVLAAHPNIAGIKDTSKDMMNAYMDAVGGREDFAVLAGSLGTILTCLKRGGKGGVVSAANYFPNTCAGLCETAEKNGFQEAAAYHARLTAAAAQTGGRASVAGVKAAMNLMGYEAGIPREPILPCSEELQSEIKTAIEENREFLGADMRS